MSRSIWKGPFSLKLLSNNKTKFKQNKAPLVWSRNSMISPNNIGEEIQIYSGNSWVLRKIVEEMVGHKVGEFCSTKKKTIHKVNKTRQISRKK